MVSRRNNRRNRSEPIGKIVQGKSSMPSVIDPQGTTPSSIQYDLFTTFWGDAKQDQSNSVEFWDALPKFSVHRNKQIELRHENGFLPIHKADFTFREQKYLLELQPAYITEGNRDVGYYPSSDEELIWEVLIKYFADQQYGLHMPDEEPPSSFVRFSLHLLQRELGKHGHKRSLKQIRHAVEVLSRCMLVISKADSKNALYRAPILADVLDVSRNDYLDDPTKLWVGRLPVIVSFALKSLEYRQYNYATSLSFKDPLSRWVHKRITHRFTQASLLETYNISLSRIVNESGYLEKGGRVRRHVARIDKVLQDLCDAHVLTYTDKDERRGTGRGKPIQEVIWTLHPHPAFCSEVKAANGRLKDARARLSLVKGRKDNGAGKPLIEHLEIKENTYNDL